MKRVSLVFLFLFINLVNQTTWCMDDHATISARHLALRLKSAPINLEQQLSISEEMMIDAERLIKQIQTDESPREISALIAPITLTESEIVPLHGTVTGFCSLHDDGYAAAFDGGIVKIFDRNHGCQKELNTHSHEVHSLTQLETGSLVTSASNFTLTTWNISTGKESCSMCPSSSGVGIVCPLDENLYTVAFNDHTIRICNASSGRCCSNQLRGHFGKITTIAQHSHRHIVSGSEDGTVIVWDIYDAKPLHLFNANSGSIRAITILNNGFIAAGSQTGAIHIWNLETKKCAGILHVHTKSIRSLITLANGTLASIADDASIKLWNAFTGTCIASFDIENTTKIISLVEHNNQLIAVFGDGTMMMFDLYPKTITDFFSCAKKLSPEIIVLIAQLEKRQNVHQNTMLHESWRPYWNELPKELQKQYESYISGTINDSHPEKMMNPEGSISMLQWLGGFFS